MVPKIVDCHETYQFGKGSPTIATKKAYIPCVIGGQPLLLGVAILPEKIPFLGSNSLLDILQTNLRLPVRRVEFELLNIAVDPFQVGGHFAIKLFDCDRSQAPHRWHVWKLFSQPHVWKSPHPELLIPPLQMSAQASRNSLRKPLDDETRTAPMVGGMEANGASHVRLCLQPDHLHDQGGKTPFGSTGFPLEGIPTLRRCSSSSPLAEGLRPCQSEASWQRSRTVCNLPHMPHEVAMERSRREVGNKGLIAKLLYAIAAIAGTILSNDPQGFRSGNVEQGSQSEAKADEAADLCQDYFIRQAPPRGSGRTSAHGN